MFQKIRKLFRSIFLSPKLKSGLPVLRARMHYTIGQRDTLAEENAEDIAVANFELQKEALQKNLILVHRSVMVALFAALVAVILGVVAIKSRTSVTVKVETSSASAKH